MKHKVQWKHLFFSKRSWTCHANTAGKRGAAVPSSTLTVVEWQDSIQTQGKQQNPLLFHGTAEQGFEKALQKTSCATFTVRQESLPVHPGRDTSRNLVWEACQQRGVGRGDGHQLPPEHDSQLLQVLPMLWIKPLSKATSASHTTCSLLGILPPLSTLFL